MYITVMSSILFFLLISTGVYSKKYLYNAKDYGVLLSSESVECYDNCDEMEYTYRLNVLNDKLKTNDGGKKKKGNVFVDMTHEEFSQKYLGLNPINSLRTGVVTEYEPKGGVPDNLDWRDFGFVSSVKDQSLYYNCGSCYAFSAVGHIESHHAMKHNVTAVSLSEQQALDCDYLDNGCNGGDPLHVFLTLAEEGGLMKDEDYPYLSYKDKCKTDVENIAVRVKGGTVLKFKDEEDLKDAIAYLGPLSVAVKFTHEMAGKVTDDVYEGAFCESNDEYDLNHAVVVVGYGTENDKDFWIIKNSWGPEWGDDGYVRLLRGVGACGIGRVAYLANVE